MTWEECVDTLTAAWSTARRSMAAARSVIDLGEARLWVSRPASVRTVLFIVYHPSR